MIINLNDYRNSKPKAGVCFFCKKITGYVPKNANSINATFNYEPCRECKEKWEQGVPVLEMSEKPLIDGQPPLEEGMDGYPTGRYMVINREALDVDEDTNIVLMLQSDFEAVLKEAQDTMAKKNK